MKLEILKTKQELQYDYIVQGAIMRLRAGGHELGENSNSYFFNQESSKGKRSGTRKILLWHMH